MHPASASFVALVLSVLVSACTIRAIPDENRATPTEDCRPTPTDVATGELSPHYEVRVDEGGTASVRAYFRSENYANNYELRPCEALTCNDEVLRRTSDALIVLDQSYAATIPAEKLGRSYRFELRRGTSEVRVSEIPAVELIVAEPKPNAVLRRGEKVRVVWAQPTGDAEVSVVMTVQSGRQKGAQIQGKAAHGSGFVVLDGFDIPMSAGDSFDVTVHATAVARRTMGAPFAAGDMTVTATAKVSATLVP